MKTNMLSPMPSWRTLAATALFPLILINCGGTITRQLDVRDPVAYHEAVTDMKSKPSEITLRDGATYSGIIENIDGETVDLTRENGRSKIPMNDVASVSITDHAVGAGRGMVHGALWTGGIVGFVAGVGSGDFIPGFLVGGLVGGLYGGLIGLVTGAIGGTDVTYLFPGSGLKETRPEPVLLHQLDTVKTNMKKDSGSISGDKMPKSMVVMDSHPSQPVTPPPAREVFLSLEDLGKIRILLKNGNEKNSCALKAIHARSIEYEKNGVLHDLAIEDILRMETTINGRTRGVELDVNQKVRLTQ